MTNVQATNYFYGFLSAVRREAEENFDGTNGRQVCEAAIGETIHYMATSLNCPTSDDCFVTDQQKAFSYVKNYRSKKTLMKGLCDISAVMVDLFDRYSPLSQQYAA